MEVSALAEAGSGGGNATSGKKRTRPYTVFQQVDGGKIEYVDVVTNSKPEDACWEVAEGKLKSQATSNTPPKLAAVPGKLEFDEYPLETVTKLVRAKGK
jgi:hypothetical protein